MKTDKRVLKIIAGISAMAAFVVLYLVFYRPLIKEVKAASRECRACEKEALIARDFVKSVAINWTRDSILSEEDVSLAIDELTKLGTEKGIKYISMTPMEEAKKSELYYEILPIEIGIESTYERLGRFLGSLDEMSHSLITVSSFKVTPYMPPPRGVNEKADPEKLETKLVLNMYLLGRPDDK